MKKSQKNETGQISPLVDFAFKWLFANDKNKSILASFLAAMLNMDTADVIDLHIENSEMLKEWDGNKKCYLDVHLKLADGQHINVEIQRLEFDGMVRRTIVYNSKMMSTNSLAGTDYENSKKCVSLILLDYERGDGNRIHTCYHLHEDTDQDMLDDVIEIHFFELPKLANRQHWQQEKKEALLWLLFLKFPHMEEVKHMTAQTEAIQNAYEQLELIKTDKQAYYKYLAEEKAINDAIAHQKWLRKMKKELAEGKKELAEGKKELAEGRKELAESRKELAEMKSLLTEKENSLNEQLVTQALETARTLKASGVNNTIICASTGLSPEQLQGL